MIASQGQQQNNQLWPAFGPLPSLAWKVLWNLHATIWFQLRFDSQTGKNIFALHLHAIANFIPKANLFTEVLGLTEKKVLCDVAEEMAQLEGSDLGCIPSILYH